MDRRESIQQEAKTAYLNSNGTASTIIVGTGGGKSKIAIDIIKELKPNTILLLSNSENLRDNNWKAEFEKFGLGSVWESNVTSECYQTVHRWNDKYFDLVIADEIDFSLSPVYSKFFENNSWGKLLGLTGFCTEEKRVLLSFVAPICYEVSTQEMQEQGLLNKSKFIFVEFDLDISRNIKVPMKKGGEFLSSENDLYKYYDAQLTQAMISKSNAERAFALMPTPENNKKFTSAEFRFKMMAAKRKSILNNLDSSIKVTQTILNHINSKPNNKTLVFSALVKQGAKLNQPMYSGDADISVLKKFDESESGVLCVCKKLNRGVNLQGVNYLIKESFDGSETDFQQQHGRLMRLKPDEVAKIIVLVPYYKALVKTESKDLFGGTVVTTKMQRMPTQARKWAERMMASFDNISGETVTVSRDYKTITK